MCVCVEDKNPSDESKKGSKSQLSPFAHLRVSPKRDCNLNFERKSRCNEMFNHTPLARFV